MEKSKARILMIKELKGSVVPQIKLFGFKGAFPHFRRQKDKRYDFVSFQFNKYGGSFVTECGFVEMNNLQPWEKELGFEKLNYGNAQKSLRLGAIESGLDHWFEFENFKLETQFRELAESVNNLLPQMEEFLK